MSNMWNGYYSCNSTHSKISLLPSLLSCVCVQAKEAGITTLVLLDEQGGKMGIIVSMCAC